MEAVDVDGVKVFFPFKPYDIQLDYMKAVITCLKTKNNGLLESPTGTGKTLSLLCAALGWLEQQKLDRADRAVKLMAEAKNNDPTQPTQMLGSGFGFKESIPKILYTSRTHQQLSQACKELKTTYYSTFTRAVVIGSRDQLCLDTEVNNLDTLSAKNQMCRNKTANQLCPYYKGYEGKVMKEEDYNTTQVFDIEDLMALGKQHKCCPYYASRLINKSRAQLVFSPYNYVIDPTIRETNAVNVANAVIIFDEGHNIERICEDSVSTQLKSQTLATCIEYFNVVIKTLDDIENNTYEGFDHKEYEDLNNIDVCKVKNLICDLESTVNKLITDCNVPKKVHDTKVIFDMMERIGLNTCISLAIDVLKKIGEVLPNNKSLSLPTRNSYMVCVTALIEFIERVIPVSKSKPDVYRDYKNQVIKKYKVFSQKGNEDDDRQSFWNKKSKDGWTLHLWCMSASVGVTELMGLGIYNMIITSGTLTPIDSFDVEMGTKFPIRLQNSHIIKENQLAILNISYARDQTLLTSKYDNRDNIQYHKALGETLVEVLAAIPKGVLVFFCSYTAMNKSVTVWKGSRIWDRLNSVKQIFLEPSNKKVFNDCITRYKMKNDETDPRGAAFFAVCRGKLSEGMDLPNDYCRGVIMTGLPFPPLFDPRVTLKKQYLDEAKTQLSADGWYSLQMKRALNQSIGRVIRHKDDFGVILLMDSRFALMRDGLSNWVVRYIRKNGGRTFDGSIKELRDFFLCGRVNKHKTLQQIDFANTQTATQHETKLFSAGPSRPSGLYHSRPIAKTPQRQVSTPYSEFMEVRKSKKLKSGFTPETAIKAQLKTEDYVHKTDTPKKNSIFDIFKKQ